MPFSSVKRRKVEADFSGGDITGNGGALLLSAVDKPITAKQSTRFSLIQVISSLKNGCW